jgi:hypothetical protein
MGGMACNDVESRQEDEAIELAQLARAIPPEGCANRTGSGIKPGRDNSKVSFVGEV